jgi:hypothetical protein
MVSGALSIDPFLRGFSSSASEIFDIHAHIAAELAVGIARHANDPAESEIEPPI